MLIVGMAVALLCALGTNVAFLCRHRGACSVATVEWRRPWQSLSALFKAKWFAIGMVVAVFAWLLHVAAMAMAPITLVQVAISGGLVFVAILAERFFGLSLQRKQWAGIATMAIGLGLITGTVPAPKGVHSAYSTTGMIAFQATLIGFAAICMASARLAGGRRYALVLGVAAGALFAASDAALKAITKQVGDDGLAGLLTPWLIPCVLASVMAFYASARSLQDEDAVAVISLTTVGTTVATFVGGAVVFRDPLSSEPLALVLQLLGFLCVCVAAALIPGPLRAVDGLTADEPAEDAAQSSALRAA